MRRSLSQPVFLHFEEAPLEQIMRHIADQHGINVVVDEIGLQDEGVTPYTPITINVDGIQLKIVGDGPLLGEAKEAASADGGEGLEILGWRPRGEVMGLIQRSRLLISIQEWRDTFGLVEMEALACGVPIITWGSGETARIVHEEQAGLLCIPGDNDDLARQIRWAATHPQEMSRLGRNGRQAFERLFTREANYDRLIAIYDAAIAGTT